MGYPIHGKVARIDKNGTLIASTKGSEITFTVDLEDKTAQGANWKVWIAGCSEWEGKMELMFDPSNTEQKVLMDNIIAAAPGTVLTDIKFMLEDANDYFSGNIILTSFAVPMNVGSMVICSFSFKGDDIPSLTMA